MNPGMSLQQRLDTVFIKYRLSKQGIIQRIELPAIMTKRGMSIDRSTVDYMGHYKGFPVAFDAKESKDGRINFKSNLKLHQIEFLNYWKQCVKNNIPVLSGFIIEFYKLEKDVVFFLDVDIVIDKIKKGDKSILMEDIPIKLKLDETLLEEYFNGIK